MITTEPAAETDHVVTLAQAMGNVIHRALRMRDSTERGTMAVLSLLHKKGPLRPSELAELVMLDLSTVSRHTQALEREGYVRRARVPEDRRSHLLELTDAGRVEIEQRWDERIGELRGLLGDWSDEDLRALTTLLNRFAEDTEPYWAAYDQKKQRTAKEAS